jgi:hypothetical protein
MVWGGMVADEGRRWEVEMGRGGSTQSEDPKIAFEMMGTDGV